MERARIQVRTSLPEQQKSNITIIRATKKIMSKSLFFQRAFIRLLIEELFRVNKYNIDDNNNICNSYTNYLKNQSKNKNLNKVVL